MIMTLPLRHYSIPCLKKYSTTSKSNLDLINFFKAEKQL